MSLGERWGRVEWTIAALAVVFVCAFSFSTLTTKPRIGVDESVTIDVAHNLLEAGVLNISVAPGVYPPRPYTIVATGYAVTYPLAGFFGLFGFGFTQARIYMLLWMAVFGASLVHVSRELFGKRAGLFALLFTITFATFYDIGRTTMGELPGFVFFLWGAYVLSRARAGLYFHAARNSYILAGLMMGLAVATKPSLYLSLAGVSLIYFFSERRHIGWREMGYFAIGAASPMFLWVYSVFPFFWLPVTWQEAYGFLANPFGRPLFSNIMYSVSLIPQSSTLLYFAGIAALTFYMFWRERVTMSVEAHTFTKIALFYCAFGFFYFLRSPGWFRYLFAVELVLFVFWYPALRHALGRVGRRFSFSSIVGGESIVTTVSVFVVVAQLVQLFFFSTILRSEDPQTVASYLAVNIRNGQTVGILNNQQIAALIPARQRYQQFHWTGTPLVGVNPLALEPDKLPDYLVFEERSRERFVAPYREVFERYYAEDQVFFKTYFIYRKRT